MRKILDHGYLKVIETWGSDESVIESARMSTNKGFLGWGPVSKCRNCGVLWNEDMGMPACPKPSGEPFKTAGVGGHHFEDVPGDEKLLRYLYEHAHATPFEFAGMVIEVQAPIMVFREWHRHRTQSYNEMSARYTPLPDLNYIPSIERLEDGMKPTKNKQAQGAAVLPPEEYPHETAERFRTALEMHYAEAERVYQASLASGIPKELARLVLPVGRYSRMRAQANLRNWLAFLTLRAAPNAQWEIRQYAEALAEELRVAFPRTMSLFDEKRG